MICQMLGKGLTLIYFLRSGYYLALTYDESEQHVMVCLLRSRDAD